ncbi:MAG: glycosyltransferase family 39 protein, partial [Nitrospinales bacterium]
QSALAFADGNFDHVLYWNAPFYSYYLSWFLELFGRAPETIFFSQAILGSFIPVLVYLIVKNFSDRVTAAVAGLLIAVSSLAIHFSVVIQRATGQILVFSLLVYICLTLIRSIKTYKFFFLGMLLCAGFYLGQETLPTLLVFLIVSMCLVVKKEIQLSGIMQKTLWTLAGAFLAMLPLNLIYFGQSGRWLPLGRDLTQGGSAEGWALANSPSAQALDSMGFNPWRSVGESLGVFFSQPLKTVSLLLGKFLDELPGFLFDPGNIFIYPLRLSGESFFLQFYIYFFTAAGLIIFVWSRRIAPFVKILILFPIGWQLLMDSVLLYGTFRYRAPVTSLNMILTAHALKPFLFSSKVKRDEPAIASSLSEGTMAKDRMGNLRRQWLILSSAGLLVIVSLFILISERDISSPTKPDLKTEVTPWSLLDGQQLKATNAALINRTVFAFYKSQRENPFNATITFNMCRFLMPGWKPYYRLAVNGRFISEPKKIAHGCSETSASFDLPQKEGIINLYIYVSDTGETADPVPQQVTTKKIVTQWGREIQSIFIPLVPGLGLDKGLRRKIELFNHYSWGFVKISPVVFSKKPNAS